MTVCTMPECQTTAGCRCWPQRRLTKIECRSPCWECPEYHDLQRWRENDWADCEKRERELLRNIERLRAALRQIILYADSSTDPGITACAKAALITD